MDDYVQYVRSLRAYGYTSEQIQGLLVARGLDGQAIQALLSLPDPTPQASAILKAYVAYVQALLERGAQREAVEKDLTARGINAQVTAMLLQMALQATSPAAGIVTSKEELDDATDHLIKVADHLSEVADTLEGVELKLGVVQANNTALPRRGTPVEDAQHLASVTDHLATVADTLEAAGTKLTAVPSVKSDSQKGLSSFLAPTVSSNPVAEQTDTSLSASRKIVLAAILIVYADVLAQSLLSGERTTIWLALISMNVMGTVGFDLLLRRSAWRHVDKWLTATVMQTGLFLPFLAKEIAAPIHFPAYTPFEFLLLGCAVIALISLQFCNVKALQHLEASVFSVVYNTRILLTTALGTFFLSESIGLWALLGGLLIFAAILIIRQKGGRAITMRGILFGLGAALAISVMNTCEKELIKLVGYEQYIFPMFAIAAFAMWAVVLLRRTPSPFRLLLQPQSLLLMALRACAGIGFSYSLVFGPVAISSYLSSLSVVLLVVFGMLFLNERDYIKSKLWATALAVAGLTFILIDNVH